MNKVCNIHTNLSCASQVAIIITLVNDNYILCYCVDVCVNNRRPTVHKTKKKLSLLMSKNLFINNY